MTKIWELLLIERSGKVRFWGKGQVAEMSHEQYLQTFYQAKAENPAREIIYYVLRDGWEPFAHTTSSMNNGDTLAFRRLSKPEKATPV